MNDIQERFARRGKAIAQMGLVQKEDNGLHSFIVLSPSLRGRQTKSRVSGEWKSASCTCLEWQSNKTERDYFCEHKWAVWYLLDKGKGEV